MPYLYNKTNLDTQYSVRKDANVFKFVDSMLLVDNDGDITNDGRERRDCGNH